MEGQQEHGAQEVDLGAALGSDAGVSTQCITVYVPNKDRNGREIGNQRKWVLEAIRLLSEVNDGATAMPPVEGGVVERPGGDYLGEPCPRLLLHPPRAVPEQSPAVARVPAPDGTRNRPGRSGFRVRRPVLPYPQLRPGPDDGGAVMSRKIQPSEKPLPRLRDSGGSLPRIEAGMVQQALGAEPAAGELAEALAPVTLFALREELGRRLQSNGGRPALAGVPRRAKVPLTDREWLQLEEIAGRDRLSRFRSFRRASGQYPADALAPLGRVPRRVRRRRVTAAARTGSHRRRGSAPGPGRRRALIHCAAPVGTPQVAAKKPPRGLRIAVPPGINAG